MRLLRGLGGRVLSCGCLVGIYETYEGQVVATIDAQGATCTDADHGLHHAIATEAIDAPVGPGDRPHTHSRA
jgi:hypothetical protein